MRGVTLLNEASSALSINTYIRTYTRMTLISVGSRVEFGNGPLKKNTTEQKQNLVVKVNKICLNILNINCAHNNEYLFKVNITCIIFYTILVHCN